MIEWFTTYWVEIIAFSIIPLVFLSVIVQSWWGYRKQRKLEKHPERMDTLEYNRYNRERFDGK